VRFIETIDFDGGARQMNVIIDDALAAAEWIADALTSSGYAADFSSTSLTEVDRFFDEHAPDGKPLPNGLLARELGPRMFALGAYVGEVIRRNIGGEWAVDEDNPNAEIDLELRLSDGSTVWPVQRVMKRYQNGPEDAIAAYGASLGLAPA
jgi:hypothetical protein